MAITDFSGDAFDLLKNDLYGAHKNINRIVAQYVQNLIDDVSVLQVAFRRKNTKKTANSLEKLAIDMRFGIVQLAPVMKLAMSALYQYPDELRKLAKQIKKNPGDMRLIPAAVRNVAKEVRQDTNQHSTH